MNTKNNEMGESIVTQISFSHGIFPCGTYICVPRYILSLSLNSKNIYIDWILKSARWYCNIHWTLQEIEAPYTIVNTQEDSENNQILLGIAGLCTTWIEEDYCLKNWWKVWTECETERIGKKQMNVRAYRMLNFTVIWNSSIATYAQRCNQYIDH